MHSDATTVTGTQIHHDSWNGLPRNRPNIHDWPRTHRPTARTFKSGNQPCTTFSNLSLPFACCSNLWAPGHNDRTPSGHGGSPPLNLFSCNNTLILPGLLGPDFIDASGPTHSPTHSPDDLVRAEARISPLEEHVTLISFCPHAPPPPPPTPTFTEVSELLANLPEDIRWAVAHISIPDNGLAIAQALVTGLAVAVSDASTKDSFGTAAMVLETTPPTFRISAVNVTPGPVKDRDSTRCETAGLIGVVVIVMAVCTVHQVTTGSLTIGCDNKMSLRIFTPDFIPDPAEESFDLVSCLHALIKKSPITFHPEHVEGHQKGKRQLNRLGLLNDEMDHSAKAFWNHLLETGHSMVPPMLHIADEGYSIWHEGQKLSSAHSNVIYPILEDHHTVNYWTKDHHNHPRRIPPPSHHQRGLECLQRLHGIPQPLRSSTHPQTCF